MRGNDKLYMQKLIVANWKMYLGLRESVALAKKFTVVSSQFTDLELVLCPSFVALEEVAKIISLIRARGRLRRPTSNGISLGAQDVEPEKRGAFTPPPKTPTHGLLVGGFTGEVGLDDLGEIGVQYVLVGHSERRREFHETDAIINKKLCAVLKAGMRPILCVGEPIAVREKGGQMRYVVAQLKAGLRGVSKKDQKRVIIAYEPVWAISGNGGHVDTPEDASAMHRWIRKVIHGGKASGRPEALPPILYGGSVNSQNAAAFISAKGIDGLLIGRASTNAREFAKILQAV